MVFGDFPADPFNAVDAMAVQIHEIMQAFLNAGFDDEQAFTLTESSYSMLMSKALGL